MFFFMQVAPAIKGQMQLRGSMMIQYQPQGDEYVNFFRMITSNPTTTHDDLTHAISLIAEYGEELFPSETSPSTEPTCMPGVASDPA